MIPSTHPDQEQGQGDVLHDQGEGYQQGMTFVVGVVKYLRVSMRCPKSKFPIGIIVLDEHKSFVHGIQGLSLSTASLV